MDEGIVITSQGFMAMLSFMFISMISLMVYIWKISQKSIEELKRTTITFMSYNFLSGIISNVLIFPFFNSLS